MNKGRIPIMVVLMVMVFLYILGVVEVDEKINYAFSLSLLIFSVSSVIDTYETKNKYEEWVRTIINTLAVGVAVVLPSLSDVNIIKRLMAALDANILLLLSIFFTFAGQWAAEIKIKDAKKNKEK